MRSANSRPRFSVLALLSLLVACAVSSLAFVMVHGAVAQLIVPVALALDASSDLALRGVAVTASVLGSVIAAAALCWPLGWVARVRPLLLGAIVGGTGSLVVGWFWWSVPESSGFTAALRWVELATFAAGCVVFTVAGARAHRVAA